MGFSEAVAYNFRLEVTDAIGSKSASDVFVPTGDVLLNFRTGGKGLGVGRVAESNRLEIGLDTIFMKTVKLLSSGGETSLDDYIYSVIVSQLPAPRVIMQPVDHTITYGDTITMEVEFVGLGLTYQWYYKKANETAWSPWGRGTHPSETAKPNSTWDGIQFYCTATDMFGKSTSSDALTVTFN